MMSKYINNEYRYMNYLHVKNMYVIYMGYMKSHLVKKISISSVYMYVY